jgi:NADH-quinone oxidoreductase subunit N
VLWNANSTSFGVIVADNFGLFVTFILVIVGILTILFSSQVLHTTAMPRGEYYALLLFSITGMIMMATANDLLVIFVALEILSLGVYVLTGILRDDRRATEAAFKYFLLGAFSSAFFLYGIAFTYGITGSTRLDRVGAYLAAQSMADNPLILIALGLLLVGFAFKISAVPFHMWTPDAYEGAHAIVTGFMSTGVKAAAFAAFARVFLSAFEPFSPDWAPVIWILAAATMILGTVVGVAQSNLKRMLAYSSIAHGGYLLVGLVAANDVGKAAILFYLLAYAVTNLAAFGVIAMLGSRNRANDELHDYAGLWYSHPALAALMTVCLLSLGGIPPTVGFIGKWYIFSAAVSAGYYGLAIIGVLTSVISVFFYLRVVVMMYMAERPGTAAVPDPISRAGMAALAIAIVLIFYLGVLPTRVLDLATQSIATIF